MVEDEPGTVTCHLVHSTRLFLIMGYHLVSKNGLASSYPQHMLATAKFDVTKGTILLELKISVLAVES